MRRSVHALLGIGAGVLLTPASDLTATVVFEITSAYHHIRVIDEGGLRTLSFNGSHESRVSLRDPRQGHFEYTEYFHLPWLWNARLTNVLMIGLGGASTQRAYEQHYTNVTVETVEIDPVVLEVASSFFRFKESPRQRVQVEDGRVFLRRTKTHYGAIIMDAYVQGRYGASIPHHLATKEFFELANRRLSTNGVMAFNVIGTIQGWQADMVGAIYRTMSTVFPHVYLFAARESLNIVIIGAKSAERLDLNAMLQRANFLMQTGRVTLPTFRHRVLGLQAVPAFYGQLSPILTDDYAPIDGLLSAGRR